MTPAELKQLEADLWSSADTLRANSDLKSSEYATSVLGLIFLKFVDNKYQRHKTEIQREYKKLKGGRREKPLKDIALEKCGFYLTDEARYDYLLALPEEENIAEKIKAAMASIEKNAPELAGTLPQDEYFRLVKTKTQTGRAKTFDSSIVKRLLQNFNNIPANASGDMFGQIYQYFLGKFALAEGQGGGEFFTPDSVVRLMVEIIQPTSGRVFDPACGSGGMFVQAGRFMQEQARNWGIQPDFYVCGQEKTLETVKLAKMNIAVNGLKGEIKQANTYYEDLFGSLGTFDYVLANPPFNVDDVNLSRVETEERFNTYGVPRKKTKVKKADQGKETVPNANYLWINLFATSLKDQGRAGLVMANSASDARHSEADIRKTLVEQGLIYGMVTLPSNMFYTVTLPATLWFFERQISDEKPDDKILFIDARNVFTQIDRAHREFSPEQVSKLAVISHLRRGERDAFVDLIDRYFHQGLNRLWTAQELLGPLVKKLIEVIGTSEKTAADELQSLWKPLKKLEETYFGYMEKHLTCGVDGQGKAVKIEPRNKAQKKLNQRFSESLKQVLAGLKALDKTVRDHEAELAVKTKKKSRQQANRAVKELKGQLEELQQGLKLAESFFGHGRWLQERFPEASYGDVTGLCKLATLAEVEEQDYSLNPGRYVGVVIEEDGKTEEEFREEILGLNEEMERLNREASHLQKIISSNVSTLVK